jgi:hypothetical protein
MVKQYRGENVVYAIEQLTACPHANQQTFGHGVRITTGKDYVIYRQFSLRHPVDFRFPTR